MRVVTPKLRWIDRIYIPGLAKGLYTTIKHFLMRKFTQEYPEERRKPSPRYRGLHRLNKDHLGRIKCVACFMCATACPSKCIEIEAAEAPWEDREKYPVKFEINTLRCIFCGMCEEACPELSIQLTYIYEMADVSRDAFIRYKDDMLGTNEFWVLKEY